MKYQTDGGIVRIIISFFKDKYRDFQFLFQRKALNMLNYTYNTLKSYLNQTEINITMIQIKINGDYDCYE